MEYEKLSEKLYSLIDQAGIIEVEIAVAEFKGKNTSKMENKLEKNQDSQEKIARQIMTKFPKEAAKIGLLDWFDGEE